MQELQTSDFTQGGTSTPDRVLHHLKCNGTQSAVKIGAACAISAVSARYHLQALQLRGLVERYDRVDGRGRPKRLWTLTREGHAYFPDRHSDLAVQLLCSAIDLFGADAAQLLISAREADLQTRDEAVLCGVGGVEAKIRRLVQVRCADGYMAHMQRQGKQWMLIQDHCPIRAAAEACPDLCQSELAMFRHALGKTAVVDRVEHLAGGDRRCVYRIARAPAKACAS